MKKLLFTSCLIGTLSLGYAADIVFSAEFPTELADKGKKKKKKGCCKGKSSCSKSKSESKESTDSKEK